MFIFTVYKICKLISNRSLYRAVVCDYVTHRSGGSPIWLKSHARVHYYLFMFYYIIFILDIFIGKFYGESGGEEGGELSNSAIDFSDRY